MGIFLTLHAMRSRPAKTGAIDLRALVATLGPGAGKHGVGEHRVRHAVIPQHSVVGWVAPSQCGVERSPNVALGGLPHRTMGFVWRDAPALGQCRRINLLFLLASNVAIPGRGVRNLRDIDVRSQYIAKIFIRSKVHSITASGRRDLVDHSQWSPVSTPSGDVASWVNHCILLVLIHRTRRFPR